MDQDAQERILEAESAGVSRRRFLGAGSVAAIVGAAEMTGVAMGQQAEDTRKAEHDRSETNPGPENRGLAVLSPDSELPLPTDHGDTPIFWSSFALSRRRIQEGGLAP